MSSLIYASHQLLGLEWIKYLQGTPLLFALSILSFLGGYFVYRSSLFLHAQFGETFKSLFDTHRNKASIEDIIDEIVSITKDPTYKEKSSREKYKEAARYGQYGKLLVGGQVISVISGAKGAELSATGKSDTPIKVKASQS